MDAGNWITLVVGITAAAITIWQAYEARRANRLAATERQRSTEAADAAADALAEVTRLAAFRGLVKFAPMEVGFQPDLQLLRTSKAIGNGSFPDAYFMVVNVGSGDAFNVTITGKDNARVRFNFDVGRDNLTRYSIPVAFPSLIARIPSGGHAAVIAWWPEEPACSATERVAELEWEQIQDGQMVPCKTSIHLDLWANYARLPADPRG